MKKHLFLVLVILCAVFTVNAQTIKYEYDALGRVTKADDAVNGTRDYVYDPAGNRKQVTVQSVSSSSKISSSSSSSKISSSSNSSTTSSSYISSSSSSYTPTTSLSVIIEAESYDSMLGVWTQATSDTGGGLNIVNFGPGDWISYTNTPVTIPVSGSYKVTYRVATTNSSSTVWLKEASNDAAIGNSVVFPNTGGWQTWVDVSSTVTLSSGVHTFKVVSTYGNANINWIKIESISSPSSSSSSVISSSSSSSRTSSSSSSAPQIPTAPGISPSSGTWSNPLQVTIIKPADTAAYYTTDGSTPTTGSFPYSAPFYLTTSGTVKAISVKAGIASAIATTSYTLVTTPANPTGVYADYMNDCEWRATWNPVAGADEYRVNTTNTTRSVSPASLPFRYTCPTGSAENYKPVWVEACKLGICSSQIYFGAVVPPSAAPTITPGGSFVGTQRVSIVAPGATIYYSINDSTINTNSTVYSQEIVLNSTSTVRAIAVQPGMQPSAITTATYTLLDSTPAPGISPSSGTWSNPLQVTIIKPADTAAYYTTDGSTPTTGSFPYSAPFYLTTSGTVKAIAVKAGIASAIATTSYTLLTTPANPTGVYADYMNDCEWRATWNPVAGVVDKYLLNTGDDIRTLSPSVTLYRYTCPTGSGNTYKPRWVQACNSAGCSSQIQFN